MKSAMTIIIKSQLKCVCEISRALYRGTVLERQETKRVILKNKKRPDYV